MTRVMTKFHLMANHHRLSVVFLSINKLEGARRPTQTSFLKKSKFPRDWRKRVIQKDVLRKIASEIYNDT